MLSFPACGGDEASPFAGGQRPSVMGRLVSGYSVSPPAPPTLFSIMDQMACLRALHDRHDRCECPLICCITLTLTLNSCWTCSDAHNSGRYNSSRYDTHSIGSNRIPIR